MNLLRVFILFKIIPAFTCNRSKTATDTLSTIFSYDFTHHPSIGQVIVWQISENTKTFEPRIYYQNKIPKFESDNAYLLFTQSQPKRFCIYYWVGSTVSLEVKKVTAKYALLQYLQFIKCNVDTAIIVISREEEFIESESFHNTVNFVERINVKENEVTYHKYVDHKLPSKLPNLYIVRGENTIRIKTVPVDTKWFIKDACLILEIGYKVERLPPVNVFCGPNASENAILKAKYAAYFLYCCYNNYGQLSLIKSDPLFKVFVEVLENSDYYRSHETDDSNDHLKDTEIFVADRNRNISFHKIYRGVITRRPSEPSDIFLTLCYYYEISSKHRSFLFDSASIAGLFLYIHCEAPDDEKQRALEITEEYLHMNYALASKSTRVRITEFNESMYLRQIDFAIYFIDFISYQEMRDANEP